jgi:hypothetical protein
MIDLRLFSDVVSTASYISSSGVGLWSWMLVRIWKEMIANLKLGYIPGLGWKAEENHCKYFSGQSYVSRDSNGVRPRTGPWVLVMIFRKRDIVWRSLTEELHVRKTLVRNIPVISLSSRKSNFTTRKTSLNKIGGCIQKFPDWPPGARTANATAFYN